MSLILKCESASSRRINQEKAFSVIVKLQTSRRFVSSSCYSTVAAIRVPDPAAGERVLAVRQRLLHGGQVADHRHPLHHRHLRHPTRPGETGTQGGRRWITDVNL